MKIWKLVAGILSILFSLVVIFQSCAVGISNTLSENGSVSGTAGILVAILLLTGGIISIATRKSTKKGGSIALVVLFAIGAITGFAAQGTFGDLMIWAVWCVINALLALVSIIASRKA